MVLAHNGQNDGGGWCPSTLFGPGEPSRGTVQGGVQVEVFNLVMDLAGGGLSYADVVDDDLSHLDLFLYAGGGGQDGVDDLLKYISVPD